MNSRNAKKQRKQYRKVATKNIRKSIFSLARQRDIFGIVSIIEFIAIIILIITR